MRRATGLKKTGHAVLRHVDGALRGLERVACVPRRQLAISHADNKYEFMLPLRAEIDPCRRTTQCAKVSGVRAAPPERSR